MLDYVSINIFDSPSQTLVNTVNTVGVMGKGIALEFKNRYPEMFERYKAFCDDGTLTVGKLYLYRSPNKWVLNFPTKKHWKNPSKLEYIEAGLKKFVETYTQYGITSISFPQLGTGNGGLDWNDVRPVMERYLTDLPIAVYIHTALPKKDFVPEHKTRGRKTFREDDLESRDVSFDEFLRDLEVVAHEFLPPPSYFVDEEAPQSLPIIRCADNVDLPGEDFATLWYELKQHGALRVDEFPPSLAAHAGCVRRMLLKLGYIREINFVDPTDGPAAGLRFVPPSAKDDPLKYVLPQRETLR